MKRLYFMMLLLFTCTLMFSVRVKAIEVEYAYWDRNIVSLKEYIDNYFDSDSITKIVFNNYVETGNIYTSENVVDISNNKDNSVQVIVNDCVLYIQYRGLLRLTNAERLFADFTNIVEIQGLEYLDTTDVTNMRYMFYNCINLRGLDLSSFDTNNALYMDSMFENCSSLEYLNLMGFSVPSEVYSMFENCTSLLTLNISNSNILNITQKQYKVSSLKKIIANNVVFPSNSWYLFEGLTLLEEIDLKNVDTSNVINMEGMFLNCINLKNIDLSYFDTKKVVNMVSMFENCQSLVTLDLSPLEYNNLRYMSYMLKDCINLSELILIDFQPSAASTQQINVFENCNNLKTIVYEKIENALLAVDPTIEEITYEKVILTKLEGYEYSLDKINWQDDNTFTNLRPCTEYIFYQRIKETTSTLASSSSRGLIVKTPKKIVYWDSELGYSDSYTSETVYHTLKDYIEKYDDTTIKSIVFNDISSTQQIYSSERTYDISKNKDNSVQAIILNNTLYIQYDGTLVFNELCVKLFSGFTEVESITGFEYVDTSKVKHMGGFFENCQKLTSLDLKGFDTSNVIYMYYMFENNYKLTSLDLSNFNTKNVESMVGMFINCVGLSDINIINFDTSNVKNMAFMFKNCRNLKNIYLLNFDTTSLEDVQYMFADCVNLSTLDLSSFNINVRDFISYYTFYNTPKLMTVYYSKNGTPIIDAEHKASLSTQFIRVDKDENLNIVLKPRLQSSTFTSIVLVKVEGYEYSLDKINWQDSNEFNNLTPNTKYTIYQRIKETNTTLASDVSEVLNVMTAIKKYVYWDDEIASCYDKSLKKYFNQYYDISLIKKIIFNDIDNSNEVYSSDKTYDISKNKDNSVVGIILNDTLYIQYSGTLLLNENAGYLFADFLELEIISGFENIDTSNVVNMEFMFFNCEKLKNLDLSNFDTSKVTRMSGLFANCVNLSTLDLSNFDTKKVTAMDRMFSHCKSLVTLNLNSFNTSNVETMWAMFLYCEKLKNLDLSNFDTKKVTEMNRMFSHCKSLVTLNLNSFNTSNVLYMESMFFNCESLLNLNLNNFDTYNVIDMQYMFSGCLNLETLDLSNFDLTNLLGLANIFNNTPKLITVYYSKKADSIAKTSAGEHTEFIRVDKDENTSDVLNPVLISKTDTNITLTKIDGYEYSLDQIVWQDSNEFNDLEPNTQYTFYQRIKETNTMLASKISELLLVKTKTDLNISISDYEGYYDGMEHTINIKLDEKIFHIIYSLNGNIYDLIEMPKFSLVGLHKIFYKIVSNDYNDYYGENSIAIYGITEIDKSINLNNNIMVIKNYMSKMRDICEKVNFYANNFVWKHYNSNKEIIEDENLKTGDSIELVLNNVKTYEYEISISGDLSGDGEIDSLDLASMMNHISEKKVLGGAYLQAAYLNNDEEVDSLDLAYLMNHIAGKEGY